jgi:hypothetical protein
MLEGIPLRPRTMCTIVCRVSSASMTHDAYRQADRYELGRFAKMFCFVSLTMDRERQLGLAPVSWRVAVVAFFCSAAGGAILPSRPAQGCGRRAERRSRTAPLGGPKGLSLYGLSQSSAFYGFSHSFMPVSLFEFESRFFAPTHTCGGRRAQGLSRSAVARPGPRSPLSPGRALIDPSTVARWLWSG